MQLSIRFTRPTVKLLIRLLKDAYDAGAFRSVRRISVLLGLAKGESVIEVAETFSVSRQAVYNWLKDFLLHGVESVVYRRPTGRKPKLTKTQKRRLIELVEAGPLAAGYLSHCWTALLIQQLILREFGDTANFAICSEQDQQTILKQLTPDVDIKEINQYLEQISDAKNRLLPPDSPEPLPEPWPPVPPGPPLPESPPGPCPLSSSPPGPPCPRRRTAPAGCDR